MVSHLLCMREALGSIPSVSIVLPYHVVVLAIIEAGIVFGTGTCTHAHKGGHTHVPMCARTCVHTCAHMEACAMPPEALCPVFSRHAIKQGEQIP